MFVCQNKKIVCHSRTTLLPYPNPHTILRSLIGNYKACFTHKGLSFDNLLCLKQKVSVTTMTLTVQYMMNDKIVVFERGFHNDIL